MDTKNLFKTGLLLLTMVLSAVFLLTACGNDNLIEGEITKNEVSETDRTGFVEAPAAKDNSEIAGMETGEIEKEDSIISYSLSEVTRHSVKEDCWLAIDGKVYDVTNYIKNHPGGDSLIQGCGSDATELYITRPMGSGTAHSEEAKALLNDYFIGNLQ